ncbi:Dyp-type peroxidase [Corynebacterium choanae]|uniref:Putative deferrochelatase/peroxidase YfeX n=1 Tax=Corynebacterium choanae TaxID=1862358 RepID=A0A3G6JCH6_9CORY|nr:Dyp-type peroxidase [Corynebacterium choanae]AZA14370.1 putative deferrochelatase/peroxidase YfeX [Corynebacterium choanae]
MTYQPAITAQGTSDHLYLEFDLANTTNHDQVRKLLARVANPPTTMGVNIVIGVRPSLWQELAPAAHVPHNVHDFAEPMVAADGYEMAATQHDVWVWIAGPHRSHVFQAGKEIITLWSPAMTLASETDGWVYQNNRDLTGFEDGTENPGALEAPGIVAIPDGEPGAGSSVLLYQLWQHLATQWDDLSEKEQEDIIGRTKDDSEELDDDVKPDSAHAARTVVEVEGEELSIFRHNTAYGGLQHHGTVFVGFSFDQWRTEEMLRRMLGLDGGPRDALTYFSEAVTGAWYVCPSVEALLEFLPDEEEDD